MNLAEKILVVVDQEVSYNLCHGGHGGFGYINKFGLSNRNINEEQRIKISSSLKLYFNNETDEKKEKRLKILEKNKTKAKEGMKKKIPKWNMV